MTTALKECPDTKPSKFKRVRPFNGMMLTEEDYRQEQNYFREKIKLHNRVHGYGIVCGLQIEKIVVTVEELAQNSDKAYSLRLHSGMAIDWNGEEIIVCEDRDVNLRKCISDIVLKKSAHCQTSPGTVEMIVGIKYDERPGEPRAIFAPHCGNADKPAEFSRTCESYNVHLFAMDDPALPQPDSMHPDWSCPLRKETGHSILLGKISFNKTDRKITTVTSFQDYFHEFPLSYPPSAPENQFIPVALIERMAKQVNWVNVSLVTGMEKDAAADALVSKGFSDAKIKYLALEKMPASFLRFLFQRNAGYLPFAANTEEVLLVHDSFNAVLFPIAAPEVEFTTALQASVSNAGWVNVAANVAGSNKQDAIAALTYTGFARDKIKCVDFVPQPPQPFHRYLLRRRAEGYLAFAKTDEGILLVCATVAANKLVQFPVIVSQEELDRLVIPYNDCSN
ncbi:MAG: hypothetical protein AAB354_10810 [candidate division KSB1 bacterium]